MGDNIDFKDWYKNKYFETDLGYIIHGDCLEVMDELHKNKAQFNLIVSDLPYGTTARNKWDQIIPFEVMWRKVKNITYKNAAILLFGDEPFTSQLICSNFKMFKQRITWDKDRGSGFLNAKKMLLKQTEDICLFYQKPPTYNPQMVDANPDRIRPNSAKGKNISLNYGEVKELKHSKDYKKDKRYPTNLIKFSSMMGDCNNLNRIHPTQKPVELLKWLINTYSNENDIILDFTAGVMTTGLAAEQLNRRWICIEKEEKYCELGKQRFI